MVVLSILTTLIVAATMIWIFYLIAKEFYIVAQAKGYSEKKYLWLCFLLGVIGYLLVIALPDRSNTPVALCDELPDL